MSNTPTTIHLRLRVDGGSVAAIRRFGQSQRYRVPTIGVVSIFLKMLEVSLLYTRQHKKGDSFKISKSTNNPPPPNNNNKITFDKNNDQTINKNYFLKSRP